MVTKLDITKVKPVGNQLLIQVKRPESKSGIILNTPIEDTSKAVVVAIGTNCTLGLEVGHEVMFKANTQVVEIMTDYLLIPEHSISAIVNFVETSK